MPSHSSLAHSAILVFLGSLASVALGYPLMLLDSKVPKCMTVLVPLKTTLTVDYTYPDYVEPASKSAEDQVRMAQAVEDKAAAAEDMQEKMKEGMDVMWNDRMQQKLENIKTGEWTARDAAITVTQRNPTIALEGKQRRRSFLEKQQLAAASATGVNRVREEISGVEGSFQYRTGSNEGPVEICVQTYKASPEDPRRISLKISQQPTSEAALNEEDIRNQEAHLSRFDRELSTMLRRVDQIMSNAGFSKDQEVGFLEQTLRMRRGMRYWPMVHVFILIVTAIVQVNHVLKFFRAKHVC